MCFLCVCVCVLLHVFVSWCRCLPACVTPSRQLRPNPASSESSAGRALESPRRVEFMHWCGVASRVNRGATRAQRRRRAGRQEAEIVESPCTGLVASACWAGSPGKAGQTLRAVAGGTYCEWAIVEPSSSKTEATATSPPGERAFHTLDTTELQLPSSTRVRFGLRTRPYVEHQLRAALHSVSAGARGGSEGGLRGS